MFQYEPCKECENQFYGGPQGQWPCITCSDHPIWGSAPACVPHFEPQKTIIMDFDYEKELHKDGD